MYKGPKIYLVLMLLAIWVIDFIDMRYFYYFFKREAHQIMGMEMHFTVAWRYLISAGKWLLTVLLFPGFFASYKKRIALLFCILLVADVINVALIKFHLITTHIPHNIFYSLLRLKIMDNYFLVFIAGLGVLDQLSTYHERTNRRI
jgi:hypothetical protein